MRRHLLAITLPLLLVSCIPSAPLGSNSVSSKPAENRLGSVVEYGELNGQPLKGYLAVPKSEGPFPALVLIHQWWGLNQNIRDFAEKFANEGYAALAVDLYGGKVATTSAEAQELAGSVRSDIDGGLRI